MIKDPLEVEFHQVVEFMKFMNQAKTEKERESILKNKDFRELHNCFPLLVHESLIRKKRLILGKIKEEDHPFDVVIEDEDHWKQQEKLIHSYFGNPIFIQLKEIIEFNNQAPATLDNWLKILQNNYINKIAKRVVLNSPEGVLYFLNNFLFSDFTWKEMHEGLNKLNFPQDYPYKQAILSVTEKKEESWLPIIHTWQIYPEVARAGSTSEIHIPQFKEIYGLE